MREILSRPNTFPPWLDSQNLKAWIWTTRILLKITNSEKQLALVAAVIAGIAFTTLTDFGGGLDVTPGFFWEPE